MIYVSFQEFISSLNGEEKMNFDDFSEIRGVALPRFKEYIINVFLFE